VAGVAVAPRGERKHGASAQCAWLATAGGSGGSCSAEAAWSTGSGLVRSEVYRLYPRYAAAEWILWMKPGRGLWHFGAQRRQRCRSSGRRRGQQHRLGGVASAESASRTIGRSCFGTSSWMGDDNGRGATAAVMRYGYWRVECFEGYEPRLRGTTLLLERTGARP
jgi:hypothetical protein